MGFFDHWSSWVPGVSAPLAWLSLAVSLAALAVVMLPLVFLIRTEPAFLRSWLKGRRASGLSWSKRVANSCDAINIVSGQLVSWLVLVMLLEQFLIVILRYVFSWGSIEMQESIWYLHAVSFMIGIGYTLMYDGHVRVDFIYNNQPRRRQAQINALGVIFFLLPLCVVTWWLSWDYVVHSWEVKESSTEGSGLPWLYLFKTLILVADVFLTIQAVSLLLRSLIEIRGTPKVAPPPEHAASYGP